MNNLVEDYKYITRTLNERLEVHDNSMRAAQDKFSEICEGLRNQIDEFEKRICNELEYNFNKEDSRLQNALSGLSDVDMNKLNGNNEINKLQQAIQKAKAELLVMQSYMIVRRGNKIPAFDPRENGLPNNEDHEEPLNKKTKIEIIQVPLFDFMKMWKLIVDRNFCPETLELRRPKDIRITNNTNGKISIQFTHLNPDEKRVLSEHNLMDLIDFKCLLSKKGNDANNEHSCREYTLKKMDDYFTFTPDFLEAEASYEINVKAMTRYKESEWSDETAEFTTSKFKECCVWKECTDYVEYDNRYFVKVDNPRISTTYSFCCCTIIGNTSLPPNKVTSWNIKILKSQYNDGGGTFIGVAPFDINQNEDNYISCGWYFDCYRSMLYSGPPHNYRRKEYGPRKDIGKYVKTGDSAGVVMNTTKGELSFVLNEVNLGVAYEGISLDKPLVPCVLLYNYDDSVEFVI